MNSERLFFQIQIAQKLVISRNILRKMEDKKEQFELLSRELLGRLNDVNRQSDLFFPFGYVLPSEIEEKYFSRGSVLRGIMIKNMVLVDNSFKKFKIFPTHDVMVAYVETQKELLDTWKKEAVKSYISTYKEDGEKLDEFKKCISKIVADINKASMDAIKTVASSDEAKELDKEYNPSGHTSFSEFIQNAVMNLFK